MHLRLFQHWRCGKVENRRCRRSKICPASTGISLNKGKQVLSIQEEVELLQSYLKIQQMRFRDSVQVEYEIAREVLTYRTIKLLLQPLVENAIHHARKEEEVLHIAVRIQKEERDVVFQVTDDGCGIEAEKLIKLRSSLRRSEEGYGLRNVANRFVWLMERIMVSE